MATAQTPATETAAPGLAEVLAAARAAVAGVDIGDLEAYRAAHPGASPLKVREEVILEATVRAVLHTAAQIAEEHSFAAGDDLRCLAEERLG